MKSIYLLCEYGVAYGTVKVLNDNNITVYDIVFNEECLNELWGKNSKKKLDIVAAAPLVLNDTREDSIFSLIDFGLSTTMANTLFYRNIKITDIMMMDEITAKNTYDIGVAVFLKINDTIIKYYDYKRNNPVTIKGYPNYVYNYIKTTYNKEKFELEDLAIGLKILNYNVDSLENDITYLIENTKLKEENGYYYIPMPRLIEQINLLKKEDYKNIILKKLEGRTLESIGKDYGVTRERIRQIIAKIFAGFPELEEDRHRNIFQEYDFDCATFCEIFSVEKYEYYYLKERYSIGQKDILELLDLDILNEYQKELLRKKCNIIIYNGESLLVTKTNVLEAILKAKDEQIEMNEIITLYNKFIDDYNLQDELDYLSNDSIRNIEGVLGRAKNVIGSYNRKYRYYDITELTKEDIIKLQELFQLEPGIYSTELFINTNPLLIKELDIKDEYELHYILKRLFSDNEKLNFTRMPDVLVDYSNSRLDFIEEKIKELAPISVDEFCQFINENYGHKIDTLKGTVMHYFVHYIDNYVLKTNNLEFTDEQRVIMSECLKEDVYSIDTIKHLLTDNFNVDNFDLINNMNLLKIGYKVRGGYILKSSITNLDAYLYNKILSNNYYELDIEYKKIGSTFSNCIYKMMYDKDLFKISDDKYITIKGLNELGINKNDIEDLQQKIIEIAPDNEYFNLSYIKKRISLAKFENKGLNDEFYENIIFIIPEFKMCRISSNKMFIKAISTPTKEKFISSIIEKLQKVNVSSLKQYLYNNYEINVDEIEIRQCINKKKFYYHDGTDCIYLNKEMYDNEVNEWDILKYIN